MKSSSHEVTPIGWVHSPLRDPDQAPKQGSEGAPDARVQIEPTYVPALDGIDAGQDVLILTWLHQARRDVLVVHPRDDPANHGTPVLDIKSALEGPAGW